MGKFNEPENPSVNILGNGTVVKGDIEVNGDIRIDGILKGSLRSKGKVIVGASGVIEGELSCQNADISGNIKAKVFVNELLSLKSTAKLFGDIVTSKLAIEPGAIFTGTCSMSGNNQTSINVEKNVTTAKTEAVAK